MFTIKLNNESILSADGVEERYSNRAAGPQSTLTIRINSNAASVDALREALEAEGALDMITVTDETGVETIFTNYVTVQTINKILVSGGANIQIILAPTNEIEE